MNLPPERASPRYARADSIEPPVKNAESPLPPVRGEHFVQIGEAFLRFFKKECQLEPHEHVLDVGCGNGRIAIPLTQHLSPKGRYEGFDIQRNRIEWCSTHITPRFPNFRFQVANIHDERFNPTGSTPLEAYRFPYGDEQFDFVVVTNVFMFIQPQGLAHYVSEISRVLRPGGRALMTFFLLNDESLSLVRSGQSNLVFDPDAGEYRLASATSLPRVVHKEEVVLDLCERRGLEVRKPLYYGGWVYRTRPASERADIARQGEDIAVADRRAHASEAGELGAT
jgi:SAM-dependent methyltransferase